MKRQKILFMIALLCTIVQGTRAQNYDVWDGTTTTQPSYSDHAIPPAPAATAASTGTTGTNSPTQARRGSC